VPGFEATHHQLGNHRITLDGDQADVFCYGTATHSLPEGNGPLWTVVGTYNFHLTKSGKTWRVDTMKFNLKYQDGNTALPELAQKRIREESK
jgi:hypothetical protein